jgi:acetyl-CoA acetyltransferase
MSKEAMNVVISGFGMTELTRESGRTVLDLAVEASVAAVSDAGILLSDVDGISTFSLYGDSVPCASVASSLGLGDNHYMLDANVGGQSPSHIILMAAAAVRFGLADHILVFRALNGRSGKRLGRELDTGGSSAYRYISGLTSYPQVIAMWVQRYLLETGGDERDLGAAVIAQRKYAELNARAVRRKRLTLEDYLAEPYVATPFRRSDCAIEVDGAAAVLISRREMVSAQNRPLVGIRAGAWITHEGDLDLGGSYLATDFSRSFASHLSERLYSRALMSPADIDIAELYDCFSGLMMMNLEGFGFCGRGEAGQFLREGHTGLNGSLPTNTNGGLLAEGYLHGLNTVIEAVRQLQGRGGALQVPDAATALVCSGGRVAGSAMILERLS